MVCACSTVMNVKTETISRIGTVDNVNNVAFKDWKPPAYDNDGERSEKFWQKAAAVGVATLNTVAMIAIANKQYSIAKEYANLAKEKWERFKATYMPCEQKEIAEACATPEYTKLYADQGATYSQLVRQAFGRLDGVLSGLAKRYSLCLDTSLTADVGLVQSTALTDSVNFAYRYEEARKEAQDDLRWNRRAQSLNRGRDIEANAARYADMASSILSGLGNTLSEGLTGALNGLGYLSARAPTQYPNASGSFLQASAISGQTGNGALSPGVAGVVGNFNDFTSPNATDGTGGFQVSPGASDFQVLGGS